MRTATGCSAHKGDGTAALLLDQEEGIELSVVGAGGRIQAPIDSIAGDGPGKPARKTAGGVIRGGPSERVECPADLGSRDIRRERPAEDDNATAAPLEARAFPWIDENDEIQNYACIQKSNVAYPPVKSFSGS